MEEKLDEDGQDRNKICADYIIAINTTKYTERQQFSAVTVSLNLDF